MRTVWYKPIPDRKLMNTVEAILEAEQIFNEDPEHYETVVMRPSEEDAWNAETAFPPITLVRQSSGQLIRDIKATHGQAVREPQRRRLRPRQRNADKYKPAKWKGDGTGGTYSEDQKRRMTAEAEQAALDFPSYQLELWDAASSQEPE